MGNMKIWFNNYKVLILGFISAIAMPLYELQTTGQTSPKILLLAASTAAITWISRNLRGQWFTIAGLVGSSLITALTDGVINWRAVVLQILIQIIGVALPPAKSVGYERTAIIMETKKEGEQAVPTEAPPAPNKI